MKQKNPKTESYQEKWAKAERELTMQGFYPHQKPLSNNLSEHIHLKAGDLAKSLMSSPRHDKNAKIA